MEAVARQFGRRDIIPEVASLSDLGQKVSDQVNELSLRPGDMLASMQQCREFGAVVLALVGDERVGLEHSFEPLTSIARLVPDFGEMFEMAGDMTFVPGDQDRSNVWEVFVQCRTPYAGLLGDLRHRHRCQPVLSHKRLSGVQGCVAHCAAVLPDRLVPQLRHHANIRNVMKMSRYETQ